MKGAALEGLHPRPTNGGQVSCLEQLRLGSEELCSREPLTHEDLTGQRPSLLGPAFEA